MTEPKKAMKVTVLPAGHPLLRNISSDQQIVIRQHQPGTVNQQTQQQVFSIRQPMLTSNQQIFIRQQATGQVQQQQPVMIRQQQLNGGRSIEPLIIRPQADGQIRLTPSQLSTLSNQQIIIRQQQPQQLQSNLRLPQQQIVIRPQQLQQSTSLQRPQLISSSFIRPLKTTGNHIGVEKSTIQQQQPVVTYLKQNSILGVNNDLGKKNNLIKNAQSHYTLQNIKTTDSHLQSSRSNIRLSLPSHSSAATNNLILTNSNSIGSSNMIRLNSSSTGKISISTTSSDVSPSSTLSTSYPINSNINPIIRYQNNQIPVKSTSISIQKQKPNVIRTVSNIKQIAPKSVSIVNSPVTNHHISPMVSSTIMTNLPNTLSTSNSCNVVCNTKPKQISLLSPNRNIQPKNQGLVEGLQLITADGKFINTEGLHLLSPNGTVIKAENLLQNITLKHNNKGQEINSNHNNQDVKPSGNNKSVTISSSKQSTAAELTAHQLISNIQQPNSTAHEINAQQLISNLQPIPFEANMSLSSLTITPPPNIIQTNVIQPNIFSPPPIPQNIIRTKFQKNKEHKDLKELEKTAINPEKVLKNNILPSSTVPKVSPTLFSSNAQTSIQNLLPTQPLLPSQIKGLTPVARPLNFTPKVTQKPPRGKSKKETQRAKVQKLEANLKVQPLLALIDRKNVNNNIHSNYGDSDVDREFLTSIENELRGELLTKETIILQDNFYKQNKVNRLLSMNLFTDSETEEELQFDDSYLHDMLKKHIKRARRKLHLLSSENEGYIPSGDAFDLKLQKGRGRGRPGKIVQGSTTDNQNLERHRLWISIMKKEVGKGGKARNYNSKEKMASAKRIATACMRAQRHKATASQRAMKEAVWRAKRLTREMQAHWKKYEREEKQVKKAKEKVASEQRRQDIEILEAKRQQRKLNFLITQTELYAHFMAGKIGAQKDTEISILSKLNSDITDERLREIDDYDEESIKERAKQTAIFAAQKQEAARVQFDSGLSIERQETDSGALKMSEAAETAGDRPQPDMFQGKLKSYQLKGMNWLCSLYDQGINGILADEMGLGKTVQALAFLANVSETSGVWGPFLVVTPASTLHNWQQEIARFVPQFKCVPYWGSPQERKVLRGYWTQTNLHTKEASFHIVVTSYQIVITDYKYFNRHAWQYMVLDEAQAIKSASSQRWKMLLEFKCRGRLLLSGTPIQNTMAELWSLLHFVMPALFDSHDEFKEWFSKDIEGHAEGTKQGKVDEKQMGRLHLILKPFMLRRLKKEVENELTDKVEVLVYCPLTIRQKLLYTGLKQNMKMDDLLAGLGLGNGSMGSMGVTSLMNLVMQFRKVCNHPELFERREPKSALLFNIPPTCLPKLPFLDPPNNLSASMTFSIYRSDLIHDSLNKTTTRIQNHEYLEVSESPFSFLRFVNLTPGDLEKQTHSIDHKLSYISSLAQSFSLDQFRWTESMKINNKRKSLILPRLSLPNYFLFTSHSSTFLSHRDIRISACPETISHRQIRSRRIAQLEEDTGTVHLVSEFPHKQREEEIRLTCPTECPNFLLRITPKAGALPHSPQFSSRTLAYQIEDHSNIRISQNKSGRSIITHGSQELYQESQETTSHYTTARVGGLDSSRPCVLGWSGIVIPEKQRLISDAGKLFVLDQLLGRLKEGGHRVLIYSQMTRMIDLLEEYMSHRQHSYMRLDGSSKIHERRDMVADFQQRQDIFIFLLSTRAGGLGINLTAADTVIFYDSDWNPTVDQQAMDRAHRLGQTRQVTVYRLICKGTIEERILQRAREKSEIHRMVIQGGSFKGKSGDLKPKEVVSLLLDDDEIEKRVKVKLEEEEEKLTKEKKEKNKSRKRDHGGDNQKENLKKIKHERIQDTNEDIFDEVNSEPLFDFDGDKMGPKKSKGKGAKKGRPKLGIEECGKEEASSSETVEIEDNIDLASMEASDEVFGFYNQT